MNKKRLRTTYNDVILSLVTLVCVLLGGGNEQTAAITPCHTSLCHAFSVIRIGVFETEGEVWIT